MSSAVQASAPLSIKQSSIDVRQHHAPEDRILSRGLIVASTACAVLSLIPPFRLAGAIALRSVSILSSLEATMSNWSRSNFLGKGILIGYTVVAITGLIAISAAVPLLAVASLIADTVVQFFELINALYNQDAEAQVKPFFCLLINGLMLAGVLALTHGWMWITGAAAASAIVMLALAIFRGINSENKWNVVHSVCYGILSGVSTTVFVTTIQQETFPVPTPPLANALSLTDTYEDSIETLNKKFKKHIKEALIQYDKGFMDNAQQLLQEAIRCLKKGGVTHYGKAPKKLLEHIQRTGFCTEWHVKILQHVIDKGYELHSSRHAGKEIPALLDIFARTTTIMRSIDLSCSIHNKQLLSLFLWYEQFRGLEPFKFEDVYTLKRFLEEDQEITSAHANTNSILQVTGIRAKDIMRKIVELAEEYDLKNMIKEVTTTYRNAIINAIGDLGGHNTKINVNSVIADYVSGEMFRSNGRPL